MAEESKAGTGGAKPHRLLITLNRITAGLSILAAILLYIGEKSLGVPSLGEAPHHEPVIVHCLLTAVLLLGAGWRLKAAASGQEASLADLAGSLLLGAFAILNIQLAFVAGLDVDPATVWVIALALPGFVCGWASIALLSRNTHLQDEDPYVDETSRVSRRIIAAAEQSRIVAGRQSSAAGLFDGLVAIPVFGAVVFLPMPWLKLLDEAVFEKHFAGWEAFAGSVIADFQKYGFNQIWGLVMLVALVWMGVHFWMEGRWEAGWRKDVHRELDRRELAFIEHSAHRLEAYAGASGSGWIYPALLVLPILWMAFIVFGVALVESGWNGLGADLFEAWRSRGLEWHLYLDEPGLGDRLLLFSAIMVLFCAIFAAGVRFRRLGVLAVLDFRRDRKRPDDRWSHHRLAIARDVRRGELRLDSAFDPESYLYGKFRRFAHLWFASTAALLAINLAMLYLDRMDYDLLTEDYIETTNYWTSRVHRLGYGDIDTVEIRCAEGRRGDLELSYRLMFGKGRTINAIDVDTPKKFRAVLPRRLDPWSRADAKLRAAGAPVRHAVEETGQGPRPRFDESECRDGLDGLVGQELRKKVMPILRETPRAHLSP